MEGREKEEASNETVLADHHVVLYNEEASFRPSKHWFL